MGRCVSSIGLRNLCISNNWFTCGSVQQYSKLFEMAESGACIHDLAVAIWICSDVAWNLVEIENILTVNFNAGMI